MSNNPVFWKQANGKLVSVDEMDINHLRNVLKMIIRNRQARKLGYNIQHDSSFDLKDIDHHEFESDLGPRFNDDEARGNQW